jgi:DDB1- and CUL4-associated factor 1
LLKVPRPSVAATGVSIALYYLAYCEDAMERICTMQPKTIQEVVKYALWLLGCSHDSGRCHATMFFGLSFQFKQMLNEFDAQDGLRKLYNVISVLPILAANDDDLNLSDDDEIAARQVVRHVTVAMKKYFESHLYYKYMQVTRQQSPGMVVQAATAPAVLKV